MSSSSEGAAASGAAPEAAEGARTSAATAEAPRAGGRLVWLVTALSATYAFAFAGIGIWGVSWPAVIGFVLLSYLGMLLHEVVLHRFLSHKAFRTSRPFRFVLVAAAMMWPARGPAWWAAVHRHHHRHTDTDEDMHSPRHGAMHALIGWMFSARALSIGLDDVRDLVRDPEMRALQRFFPLPFFCSLPLAWLAGFTVERLWPASGMNAMQGLVWWGLLRAFYPLLMMGVVNSFCHRPAFGRRRFATDDASRNIHALAWLTAGVSLHNNHHHYPHGARAGFFPGEPDPAYWAIRLFEKLGLVWSVRPVPPAKLDEARLDLGAVDRSPETA